MNKGSIFLADIDGTLVRTNQPLADAVVAAAETFQNSGGRITICTGRPPLSTRSIAEKLHVSMPAILFGGGMIYDFAHNEVLWKATMDADILDTVRQILARFDSVAVLAYSQDRIFTLRANARLRQRGVQEECMGEACSLSECDGDFQKIVLIDDEIGAIEAIGAECVDLQRYEFAFASSHFAEITRKGVNKGAAMQRLAQLCGVSLQSFFAAGDAMTDLPMLRMAGVSFAMGNAPEAVKRCATYVVGSTEEYGMQTAFTIAAGLMG